MKKVIHRFIRWYVVKKCGGAFHTGKYNTNEGFYIRAFTDYQYHMLQKMLISENVDL